MKFETSRWSDARLLQEFLGFDFHNDHKPSGVLRDFLEQCKLTHPNAAKFQESLRHDLACVLTGCRYQPVKVTPNSDWPHGVRPRYSGVASLDELLKKIERLISKPMLDFSRQDRTVHIVPVKGTDPEQRLYLIVLDLLFSKRFWRLAVCRYCGRIFSGTKYCSDDCREDWHNRYTRTPRVIAQRKKEKEKQSPKKPHRKKPRKLNLDLGAAVFEEFKKLEALKEPEQSELARCAWIKARLPVTNIDTKLSWEKLPKEQKKSFHRIAEMEHV